MIFLSHNRADKPIVEPVALRLREIFGPDKVFYDSWSIQPGEGVIDKMNDGLTELKYFFYFVTANSLKSAMVKLEWQNALYKATKGQCRVVPVRVDGSPMPAILAQTSYVDMHAYGMEAAITQIVNVAQGNNTFSPRHENFSNLTCKISGDPTAVLDIVVTASHLMEPNPEFLILTKNTQQDGHVWIDGQPAVHQGFYKSAAIIDGATFNAFTIAPFSRALTPQMPMKIKFYAAKGCRVAVAHVMRRVSDKAFQVIPVAA